MSLVVPAMSLTIDLSVPREGVEGKGGGGGIGGCGEGDKRGGQGVEWG